MLKSMRDFCRSVHYPQAHTFRNLKSRTEYSWLTIHIGISSVKVQLLGVMAECFIDEDT